MGEPKQPTNSLQFQERDLALLRGLFESRLMTAAHVAALYFDGKKEASKKRLQKLKAAGMIAERKRRASEAAILFLTQKGFSALREQGALLSYPKLAMASLDNRTRLSEATLSHELEIMDVKAALHSALRGNETFSIPEFSTWPLLYEFEVSANGTQPILVKPDGFLRIHEQEKDGSLSEHTFFLEVDRSTERQQILLTKAQCYFDYYRSGGFAARNGAPRSAYKGFPFRVLLVVKNAERRNNTAERLLYSTPPILTQACLSTMPEVIANPLGPIWTCPLDYRNATNGTQFEASPPRHYRRQNDRELLLETKLRKFSLFEDAA